MHTLLPTRYVASQYTHTDGSTDEGFFFFCHDCRLYLALVLWLPRSHVWLECRRRRRHHNSSFLLCPPPRYKLDCSVVLLIVLRGRLTGGLADWQTGSLVECEGAWSECLYAVLGDCITVHDNAAALAACHMQWRVGRTEMLSHHDLHPYQARKRGITLGSPIFPSFACKQLTTCNWTR